MLDDPNVMAQHETFRLPAWTRAMRRPFLCCFIVSLVAGCNSSHPRNQIFAITSDLEQSSLSERVGVEEAAHDANIDVYWNGPRNLDVQRQIDLIATAVHAGSYGIAITPASLFADKTAIRDALLSRIPVVVLLDSVYIAPAPHLYFVLEDTQASARLVSERLNQLMNGSGEVAVLGLNPLYPGSVKRFEDLEEAIQLDCPGIRVDDRVVEPFGYGYQELGAEQVLREHPHLKAIVALNVRSGMAAAAAVRNLHVAGKVRIIVYDQSLELFILLRRGDIDSIVVQDMRGIGAKAVSDIVADRNGHDAPKVSYLKPMLITRTNIDNEAVQQFLLMNWRRP